MLLALIMLCPLWLCLCALLQCSVLLAMVPRAVACPVRCAQSAPTHLEGAHPASHAQREQQRSQQGRGSAVRQHNAAAAHSSSPTGSSTAAAQLASALCQGAASHQVQQRHVHARPAPVEAVSWTYACLLQDGRPHACLCFLRVPAFSGCFPGYGVYGPQYQDPDVCEQCTAGTYAVGGALTPCQPCSTRAFDFLTSAPGSSSLADCTCAAGTGTTHRADSAAAVCIIAQACCKLSWHTSVGLCQNIPQRDNYEHSYDVCAQQAAATAYSVQALWSTTVGINVYLVLSKTMCH
jgi:hypothetical protein